MSKNIIILGTGNRGKIKEFKKFFKKLPLKSLTLNNFNKIKEIKENGSSFKENSYKKAYSFSKTLRFPVIADDSGLVVISLKRRPSVHSSRYISYETDDTVKCKKILKELSFEKHRDAYFKCIISIVLPNGMALFYGGICLGLISKKIVINNGFGYDPIFIHKESQMTFSKMNTKKKGDISHRGLSIKLLLRYKERALSLISSWYA